MNFKLKNFGKIAEADIKLDGITVICGKNNSGKSTVGKALFCFFNTLNDYKDKIDGQKYNKLVNIIINYSTNPLEFLQQINTNGFDYISKHDGIFDLDEVSGYLNVNYSLRIPKERLESLVSYLNMPAIDVLNEYVYRYIRNVMNNQVKNVYSSNRSNCSISGVFKDFTTTISLKNMNSECDLGEPIEHSAFYINTPFSLDYLNENQISLMGSNPMNRSVIEAIRQAQSAINEDSMTNILDSVMNKKDLDEIRQVIKKAYSGDTVIENGNYYYLDNGKQFDFRNISAGLKSFALIERMLETGVLKKKDVLILDEPEIHLHSEWQIYYAELIVLLQKKFDLTILLVTHSFQFLESLDFFMKKYEVSEKGNFYIPKETQNGIVMESCGNSAIELKKLLTTGSVTLSNLKFEFEMENYCESEDDN